MFRPLFWEKKSLDDYSLLSYWWNKLLSLELNNSTQYSVSKLLTCLFFTTFPLLHKFLCQGHLWAHLELIYNSTCCLFSFYVNKLMDVSYMKFSIIPSSPAIIAYSCAHTFSLSLLPSPPCSLHHSIQFFFLFSLCTTVMHTIFY